jgi:outer membrane protein OmpA-like peptidoglycan-associated protein
VRLDRIAALLKTVSAEKSFLIRGHTAKAGTEAGQLALSQERAKRIMKALIQRGLAPGRFYWEGKGSTQPIAGNDTEEGKAKNRRVEIIILE